MGTVRGLWLAGAAIESCAAAGRGKWFAVWAKLWHFQKVTSCVEGEVAVSQFDAAAGVTGDVYVVRDHQDCVT